MNQTISNIIIFLILLSIFFFSFKGTVSHFKGEGSCCGGGGKDVRTKPGKLKQIVSVKIIKIGGMHCEHCYTRVFNALNSIKGVNAKVKGKKGEAIVKCDRYIDDAELILTITKLGYDVNSIKEK